MFTLVGALMVGISAYLFRNRLPVTMTSIVFCCVCGLAYPLALRLIGRAFKILGIESPAFPIVAWVYLLSLPVLCVFYLQALRDKAEQRR